MAAHDLVMEEIERKERILWVHVLNAFLMWQNEVGHF
jgi:hypothetical protein